METAHKQLGPEVPLQGPLPPFAGSLEALKDAGRRLVEGQRIVPLSVLQYNLEKTVLCAVVLPPPPSEVDGVGSPSTAAVAPTPVDVLRLAAVKMVRKPPGDSPADLIAALRGEAEMLASLHDSPRVAHALAYVDGTDAKEPWAALLTEYAEGGDLTGDIFKKKLSASTVRRLACQLCDVLEHPQLSKHRDLIPRNVVLVVDREAQLQLKVVDWESTSMTPSTVSSTSAHPNTNAFIRIPDVAELVSVEVMKSLPTRNTSPPSQGSDARRAKPADLAAPTSNTPIDGLSLHSGSEEKAVETPTDAQKGTIRFTSSSNNRTPYPAVGSDRGTSELEPWNAETTFDWVEKQQQQPTPADETDATRLVNQLSADAHAIKDSLLVMLHSAEDKGKCDNALVSVLGGAPKSVSPVDGALRNESFEAPGVAEADAIRNVCARAAALFEVPSDGVPPRTRALLNWFNRPNQAFPSVRDGIIVAADPSDQTFLGPFPTSDLWCTLGKAATEEFPASAAALLQRSVVDSNLGAPRRVDT